MIEDHDWGLQDFERLVITVEITFVFFGQEETDRVLIIEEIDLVLNRGFAFRRVLLLINLHKVTDYSEITVRNCIHYKIHNPSDSFNYVVENKN